MTPDQVQGWTLKMVRQDSKAGSVETETFNLADSEKAPIKIAGSEHISLTHLLEEVSCLLQEKLAETKTSLVYYLAPDMPLVLADYGQIRRALVSLLRDAAEAIDADHGVISVKIRLVRTDGVDSSDRFAATIAILLPCEL